MKSIAKLSALMIGFAACSAWAATAPTGSFVEVHSCEVYTGGCTASSESTLAGKYLLRVWKFDAGTINHVSVAGLPVAVLQTSDDNLAAAPSAPTHGTIYLPAQATAAQKTALRQWIEKNETAGQAQEFAVTTEPIALTQNGVSVLAKIGGEIALRTRALETCDAGGCGESLWYRPRTKAAAFTVALAESCRVRESSIGLDWQDNRSRNVFIGTFGGADKSDAKFVADGAKFAAVCH